MDAVPEVVHDSHKRCTLLGGTFAVLVQVGLGLAAISTLVYKRHHERPRRPWIVWIFDTTKQCFAGALQHCVNLAFGVMFAVNGAASECSWYLVNFAITVGCGVFLLWGAMRLYTRVVDKYHLTLLRSGDYGSPPSWRPWLAQLLVWGLLSASEKLVTAALVIMPLHSSLDRFAAWLETPLLAQPVLELLLVMVLAPVMLNVCFFWVMDNLIMRKRPKVDAKQEEVADEESETKPLRTPLLDRDGADEAVALPPSSGRAGAASASAARRPRAD